MKIQFLDAEEEMVYGLVKEYLQKKPLFTLAEIVEFINQRLRKDANFNQNKIELILKRFIKKKIMVHGTKLVKDDILTVDNRNDIFQFITENPGANLNDIKSSLNMGSGLAIWHLNLLEEFQFIKSQKMGNQKAYFNVKIEPRYYKMFFYMRKNKTKEVIKLMENASEPLRLTNISDELNIHYNTLKKYLKILVELKIVSKVNGEKKKRYQLNQDAYDKALNLINSFKK